MKEPSYEELKYIIVPLLAIVGAIGIILPLWQIVSLNSELSFLDGMWLLVTGKVVHRSFYIGIGLILVSILYVCLIRRYE